MFDIFGMFDKLDDIVYEPVKVVCDWLRQPLKKMQAKQEMEQKKFEAEINAMINRKDVELRADERRINAEIDKMIADAEFQRQERMVEAVKRYQIELAEVSVKIGESIGKMSLDLRKRAQDMVLEQTKKYKALQSEVMDESMNRLKLIEETFGTEDSEPKRMMMNGINEQMIGIINTANEFIKSMKNDLESMVKNIDEITGKTLESSSEWINLTTTQKLSSTSHGTGEVKTLKIAKE